MPKRIRVINKEARKGRRQLQEQKELTACEIRRAMQAASQAIDELTLENGELKRIVIIERAQHIYWMETAKAVRDGKIGTQQLKGWNDLTEAGKEAFVTKAVAELSMWG